MNFDFQCLKIKIFGNVLSVAESIFLCIPHISLLDSNLELLLHGRWQRSHGLGMVTCVVLQAHSVLCRVVTGSVTASHGPLESLR